MSAKPRWLSILDIVTGILLLAATTMVFFFTPVEAVMGPVQKVFYFHVSVGWVGMLGFTAAAVAGVIYLRTANRQWDLAAVGAVEIGLVFMLVTIVTGSIWARPSWNTWWTWDPRLTTAAIMELIYAAYLLLRQGIEEPERRARFGAVYAIVGFVSVPLTFISIRIFRTIHPVIIGSNDPTAQGTFEMAPSMLRAFIFSLVTFSFVYIDLFWHRLRLAKLADAVEQLKLKASQ
jgi:heme exporter protein C